PLEPNIEVAMRGFVATAQRVLDRMGVEVSVRAFEPVSLPALYLVDSAVALDEDFRRGRDEADGVWGAILGTFVSGRDDRPQLVLNHRNPLVPQIAAIGDEELVALAVEGLYAQALLEGHQPLRPADRAALNQSFLGLLRRAMGGAR